MGTPFERLTGTVGLRLFVCLLPDSAGHALHDCFSLKYTCSADTETQTTRKPRLSLRLPGLFLLRFAPRSLSVSLFHAPPRSTREDYRTQPPES